MIDAEDPWCYDLSKAPKDGSEFIGWKDNDWVIVHYRNDNWIDNGRIDAHDLEAWMSIPQPKSLQRRNNLLS